MLRRCEGRAPAPGSGKGVQSEGERVPAQRHVHDSIRPSWLIAALGPKRRSVHQSSLLACPVFLKQTRIWLTEKGTKRPSQPVLSFDFDSINKSSLTLLPSFSPQENPYLMLVKTEEPQVGNARFFGYLKDLMDEIGKLLNVDYELRLVKDGK